LIPVTNHRDLVFDPSRGLLYITTSAGTVQRYNVASQTLLSPLSVGTSLNGADITSDITTGSIGTLLNLRDTQLPSLTAELNQFTTSLYNSAQVTSSSQTINVAGTARVMEAVTEANRNAGANIRQFIFPSSVSAYGSDIPDAVTEDAPLKAHTLPYALHKKESDLVVQQRAPALRGCSVFILRSHIFAGASVENYLLGAFRGTPNGKSKRAARMRDQGKRLPSMLPFGKKYLNNKIQFIHVDDMARLITWLLHREPEAQRLTTLNVAGRGDALTFAQCIQLAHANLWRVPGRWGLRKVLQFLWRVKLSSIPPDAVPYMTGQYIMNTDRLKDFLKTDYERVIRYSIADAFADSFRNNS